MRLTMHLSDAPTPSFLASRSGPDVLVDAEQVLRVKFGFDGGEPFGVLSCRRASIMRLASATISSERLFSKLEGLSAIARVEPGAKIAALHPFPTGLTSMRCPLYSIVVIAHRGSVHFKSAPRLKHGARNLESFPPPRLALGLPPRGQMRD